MKRRATLILSALLTLAACGGPTAPPPPRTAARPAQPAAQVAQEEASQVVTNGRWEIIKDFFFTYVDTPLPSAKNAFWSNLDKYVPRIEMPMVQTEEDAAEEEIANIEKHPPEDYKLIMIIAGTAIPKAIVVDPDGNRHVLRKDNRMGNRNGVVDAITEFEIVIKEPYAEQPTILSIRPKYAAWAEKYNFTQK